MRKFIVLHSIDSYDKGKPIIIYIDQITAIRPFIDHDENDQMIEIGTSIMAGQWCWSVTESIGEVMKKVKEHE